MAGAGIERYVLHPILAQRGAGMEAIVFGRITACELERASARLFPVRRGSFGHAFSSVLAAGVRCAWAQAGVKNAPVPLEGV